jgi:hypothetical protein
MGLFFQNIRTATVRVMSNVAFCYRLEKIHLDKVLDSYMVKKDDLRAILLAQQTNNKRRDADIKANLDLLSAGLQIRRELMASTKNGSIVFASYVAERKQMLSLEHDDDGKALKKLKKVSNSLLF